MISTADLIYSQQYGFKCLNSSEWFYDNSFGEFYDSTRFLFDWNFKKFLFYELKFHLQQEATCV